MIMIMSLNTRLLLVSYIENRAVTPWGSAGEIMIRPTSASSNIYNATGRVAYAESRLSAMVLFL